MYQFTLGTLIFVLCVDCIVSAPTSPLLSGLLPSSSSDRDEADVTGLTTYDQKQTGKYNIHLNIKDVAIIALGADRLNSGVADFGNDYYEDYDLSDFTVKPIYGLIGFDPTTSAKPILSSTSTPSIIHSSDVDHDAVESENSTDNSDDDQSSTDSTSSSSSVNEENVVIITSSTVQPNASNAGANKTQNVIILNPSTISSPFSHSSNSNASGISITTSTPSPDSLPPNKHPAFNANIGEKFTHPHQYDQIPVQIIVEPLLSTRKLSKNRPKPGHYINNKLRATPGHNRRITPPHDTVAYESDDVGKAAAAYGQAKLRRKNAAAGQRQSHKGKHGGGGGSM